MVSAMGREASKITSSAGETYSSKHSHGGLVYRWRKDQGWRRRSKPHKRAPRSSQIIFQHSSSLGANGVMGKPVCYRFAERAPLSFFRPCLALPSVPRQGEGAYWWETKVMGDFEISVHTTTPLGGESQQASTLLCAAALSVSTIQLPQT